MAEPRIDTRPEVRESAVMAASRRPGFSWGAMFWSGILAGAVFIVLEMFLAWAVYGSNFWNPLKMIAAIIMGQNVLPPASFNFGVFIVGIIVHFVLSLIFAFIGLAILRPSSYVVAGVVMGIYGLLLYLINFYGFTAWLFPWFALAQNWVTVFSHIVYGVVLGVLYMAFRGSVMQTEEPIEV